MSRPVCVRCATVAPADAAARVVTGWVSQSDRGRTTLVCPSCAHAHVRDIEAKLDDEHWA